MAEDRDVIVLDVRRNTDYEADKEMIPSAVRRNPEQVDQWVQEIQKIKMSWFIVSEEVP